MKTNIEVTPNHPAYQQVIEFMTELLPKVEMAKSEMDVRQSSS
jgi:maltose-binding protein MalE